MHLLRQLWQAWKRVGQAIGDLIARVVLTLFYFTIFVPFALVLRLFTDPLAIKQTPPQTNWQPKEETDLSVESAREQG